MDKQKQIEEMAKDLKEEKLYALINKTNYMRSAENLYDLGYRKIPEIPKNTILTNDDISELLTIVAKDTRKETAEKFAERLKNLEEALLDMVVQFCQMGEEGKLKHIFMSAEEQAFDVLNITYGENVDDVYERFNKKWDRPIDEICKEITEGKDYGKSNISNESIGK